MSTEAHTPAPARRARRNQPRRRGRRSQRAQAVLEMAMITPIMVALVFNFLAVMLEVKGQNDVQAAVSYAAQASVNAPLADMNTSCQYASQAFWSTVYADHTIATNAYGGCPATAPGAFSFATGDPNAGAHKGAMAVTASAQAGATGFKCQNLAGNAAPDYLNGQGFPLAPGAAPPPVQCIATVKFNFANSPLGAAIFWTPTWTAFAQSTTTIARQCDPSVVKCV